MGVLLFAQDQASKGWWFDWVDAWGNTASVVGLFVSVVAFPVTWRFQRRIKIATQEAVRKVALVILSTSLDELHRQLTSALETGLLLATATEVGQRGLWFRVHDYCQNARHATLRLVGNPHLTDEEKRALWDSGDDLAQVMQYIERNKLKGDPSPTFQQDKKDLLDRMVVLLMRIQIRLGTKTWEV